jgi:hypothetical protein
LVYANLDRDRKKPTDFKSIRIMLASPEKIREWSYGEVTKPETMGVQLRQVQAHPLPRRDL